jgi:hypothetical protein
VAYKDKEITVSKEKIKIKIKSGHGLQSGARYQDKLDRKINHLPQQQPESQKGRRLV